MRLSRRWLLALAALLILLPAGGVAVAHTHLLSARPQAEPAPPDLSALPQQPLTAHDPPVALTPAARVDAQARRAASGGHDTTKPLPDGYSPTPRAGSLAALTPTATPLVLVPPSASSVGAAPPVPSVAPTALPLPPRPSASSTPRTSPSPTPSATPSSSTPSARSTPNPTPAAATATPPSH